MNDDTPRFSKRVPRAVGEGAGMALSSRELFGVPAEREDHLGHFAEEMTTRRDLLVRAVFDRIGDDGETVALIAAGGRGRVLLALDLLLDRLLRLIAEGTVAAEKHTRVSVRFSPVWYARAYGEFLDLLSAKAAGFTSDPQILASCHRTLVQVASAELCLAIAHQAPARPNADQEPAGYEGSRNAMALQLLHMDRFITLGTLAAGICHDIVNPLTYVTINLAMAREFVTEVTESGGATSFPTERLDKALEDAQMGAEHIREITAEVAKYSRSEQSRLTRLGLRPVLDSAAKMAAHEIRYRARLVREGEASEVILGDRVRLGQVFLNLLVNAAHAIDDDKPSANEIRLRTTTREGWVVVEVQDTGCGIPSEKMRRIFEPFFTSKGPGQGTGLGLSICRRIVEDHGGSIEVESVVGEGTTFRVSLPTAPTQFTKKDDAHDD